MLKMTSAINGFDHTMERIGIAVYGTGRIGSIHVKNVLANPSVKLLYVVEEDTLRAQQLLHDFKAEHVRVLKSRETSVLFKDPEVHGVMICTPTPTHEKCVMDALRAGKAVFCEKPLSNDRKAIVQCYEEASKRGLALLCSFNRRFDPGHRRVIQSAKNGKLGTIHTIATTSRDGAAPNIAYLANNPGIFHDCGIHDIDMALKIAGEPPCTVYAQAHAFIPGVAELNDADCVAITMKFPSGILATINLDRISPFGYDQRLEVLGDQAMMISDNPRPTAVRMYGSQGVTLDKCHPSFPERYGESYQGALEHFIDVVQGKTEVEVTDKDCILASKVADACGISYKTQKVVDFSKFDL